MAARSVSFSHLRIQCTDLNAFIRDILQFIFAAGPFDANIKLQRESGGLQQGLNTSSLCVTPQWRRTSRRRNAAAPSKLHSLWRNPRPRRAHRRALHLGVERGRVGRSRRQHVRATSTRQETAGAFDANTNVQHMWGGGLLTVESFRNILHSVNKAVLRQPSLFQALFGSRSGSVKDLYSLGHAKPAELGLVVHHCAWLAKPPELGLLVHHCARLVIG